MAIYCYLKDYKRNRSRILPLAIIQSKPIGSVLMVLGVLILSISIWPIIKWQFFVLPKVKGESLISPQPSWQQLEFENIKVVQGSDGFSYFVRNDFNQQIGGSFYIDIPKLGIREAQVLINSQQFDKNLAHFPGSALPGNNGNVFITGHSSLPQFFSPTNYKTIFSNLVELESGDLVIVKFNDKVYNYSVISKKIVDPSDISVILPPDDFGSYLTLMTCVPPGLNSQRLVVTSYLID